MALDSHVKRGHPIFFGLVTLFAFIELVMASYIVGRGNDDGYPNGSIRDRLRFTIFAALWTFLFSIGYIIFFLTAAGSFIASIASHAGFIAITWLWWTVTAATVTASLNGGINCSGAANIASCNTYNAIEAFAWIEWILFTLMLVGILFLGFRSSRRGDGFGGALV